MLGGRAAMKSGSISAVMAIDCVFAVVAGVAAAAAAAAAVVAAGAAAALVESWAEAGMGRLRMSMPWMRSCSMMTSRRSESGSAPRKDGSMPTGSSHTWPSKST